MICSYFSGRIGNQLFQYAYARSLQEMRGGVDDLIMNFNLVLSAGKAVNGFEDSLRYFNVRKYKTNHENLVMSYGDTRQRLIYLLYQVTHRTHISNNKDNWFKRFRKQGLVFSDYLDNDITINESILPKHRNLILYGKFENPELFQDIRPQLIEELTPTQPNVLSNKRLYEIIRNTNSICVSIRRGDYLSTNFSKDFFVCDKDYFTSAIKKAQEVIPDATFVFFSDDIKWVRDSIKIDAPSYYERGNDPVWEKLRLMYSCKHFIISNSTFSWWAQYLSRNPEKVVISPDHWYNNREMNEHARLLQPEFIKIPVAWH